MSYTRILKANFFQGYFFISLSLHRILIAGAILSLLLAPVSLNAQITLDSSSFAGTFIGTIDTFLIGVDASRFPSTTLPAFDARWNFANAVSDTPQAWWEHNAADSFDFPAAKFSEYPTPYWEFAGGMFGTQTVQQYSQRSFTASGYLKYGAQSFRQAYPIDGYFGSSGIFPPSDSIIYSNQNIVYSSPRTIIKFPATLGSSWTSAYSDSLSFALDVAAWGYHNKPGLVKQFNKVKDSVIGWGYVKVKAALGAGTSGYVNVLQTRTRYEETDSVYQWVCC